MATTEQVSLADYAAGTDEIEVTRTIRCRLQTSQRKLKLVSKAIDAYQDVVEHMAAVLPSYDPYEWSTMNTQMYHQAKRALPEDGPPFKARVAQMARDDVIESFLSYRESGQQGRPPQGQFGDGEYLTLYTGDATVHTNDKGFGLKTNFIRYNPVWFHIEAGDYQRQFLRRVVDDSDDARAGSAELHLSDGGELYAHLTISWPVSVYEPADVTTAVGVDVNDDPLVCLAVVDSDGVAAVEMESGAEYRHHRERVKERRAEAMREGDLKAVKDARLQYRNYTDHITNVASKRVVDLAADHKPAKIVLEDLTDYRETATDPIHDWPFAEIQEKIAYKARERGLPVVTVDPRNTSITCRQCGATNPAFRDGTEFECWDCGYTVHADVNAAINIATGGVDGL